MTGLGRMALALAVPGVIGTVAAALPSGAAIAQGAPMSEFGVKAPKDKPGVYVERIDGSHYRVSAYLKSMKGDPDERLKELADMVMMRAAQFALENGREYFTIVGDLDTDTIGGKTEYYRGTPDRAGPTQCYGRDGNGNLACYPGETIKGTPGGSSYNPGFFGRVGIVQFWTAAEGQRLTAETEGGPAKGKPIPAEGMYQFLRERTPGKWPTVATIYGERARRMRGD